MKKLFAVLMVAVMVLALSSMVFAVQTVGTESATTGTVTISNATVGETYQGYRIFNATVARTNGTDANDPSDDGSTAINYTWAGTGSMPTNSYFTADTSGNITATAAAGTGAGGLSDGAIALIKSWIGADNSTYSFPTAAANPTVATDTTLKFAGLDYGYWYFTSTLGTLVTIDSTNPNAAVQDKNEAPTIDKKVKEDSTGNYGKQNDAEYGQTVEFQTIINCKEGAKSYVLYDLMDSNLQFNGVSSITIFVNDSQSSTAVPATVTVNEGGTDVTYTNWTASAGGTYPDGTGTTTATFNIVFGEHLLDTLEDNYKIVVNYTATVLNTATVGTAMPNDTILTYGNAQKTAQSETKTFTWGLHIYKYTGTLGSGETALQGAEFVLARHATETVDVNGTPTQVEGHYFATVDANGNFTGRTAFIPLSQVAETAIPTMTSAEFQTLGATILTTNASGEININGLDEGSYKLIETKAPAGYNKLTQPITQAITTVGDYSTLTTDLTSGTSGVTTINVANNAGTVLPSTGGSGITILYIIGGILVAVAAVVLITLFTVKASKQD